MLRFQRTPQTIGLLKRISLFRGMSEKQLKAIAKTTYEVIVVEGKVLTRQGEIGDELILIADGTASVRVHGKELARRTSGDVIGEMCLIDGRPRSATVIAETSMTLLVIRRRDFNKLLDNIPGLARKLLVELSSRLRDADDALAG